MLALKAEPEEPKYAYEEVKLSSLKIIHNLNNMAKVVGLYDLLWRSEEIGDDYSFPDD